MPYDRSNLRDIALIRGITLLENTIKRLQAQQKRTAEISGEWIKDLIPAINNQIDVINDTSANDIASKFLVKKLNKLNDHLLSEFTSIPYALRLSREALSAMFRATQSHSHIWNQAQLESILTALGTSHVVKTKGLPYYDIDYDREEEGKDKKKRVKVLEYKPKR